MGSTYSNLDINSNTFDLDSSGDITIDTTSNSSTALTLQTNGGSDEKILLKNNQGIN